MAGATTPRAVEQVFDVMLMASVITKIIAIISIAITSTTSHKHQHRHHNPSIDITFAAVPTLSPCIVAVFNISEACIFAIATCAFPARGV